MPFDVLNGRAQGDGAQRRDSHIRQFLRFMGINPISPLLLIKQNMSYPIINILSMYLYKKLQEANIEGERVNPARVPQQAQGQQAQQGPQNENRIRLNGLPIDDVMSSLSRNNRLLSEVLTKTIYNNSTYSLRDYMIEPQVNGNDFQVLHKQVKDEIDNLQ